MIAAWIFLCAVAIFLLSIIITTLEEFFWWFRDQFREGKPEICDCVTPKRKGQIGDTFICPECARKWYYASDMVAWAGWCWAPWWKRTQMKLGLELPGRRVEPDPVVVESVLTPKPKWSILRRSK